MTQGGTLLFHFTLSPYPEGKGFYIPKASGSVDSRVTAVDLAWPEATDERLLRTDRPVGTCPIPAGTWGDGGEGFQGQARHRMRGAGEEEFRPGSHSCCRPRAKLAEGQLFRVRMTCLLPVPERQRTPPWQGQQGAERRATRRLPWPCRDQGPHRPRTWLSWPESGLENRNHIKYFPERGFNSGTCDK